MSNPESAVKKTTGPRRGSFLCGFTDKETEMGLLSRTRDGGGTDRPDSRAAF